MENGKKIVTYIVTIIVTNVVTWFMLHMRNVTTLRIFVKKR